jgi:hypothetical protein
MKWNAAKHYTLMPRIVVAPGVLSAFCTAIMCLEVPRSLPLIAGILTLIVHAASHAVV